MTFSEMMYALGYISLFFAIFTGVTVVTAAAFFVIGWVASSRHG
jgi:hypothetical protein